jgi:hypothetical protein
LTPQALLNPLNLQDPCNTTTTGSAVYWFTQDYDETGVAAIYTYLVANKNYTAVISGDDYDDFGYLYEFVVLSLLCFPIVSFEIKKILGTQN